MQSLLSRKDISTKQVVVIAMYDYLEALSLIGALEMKWCSGARTLWSCRKRDQPCFPAFRPQCGLGAEKQQELHLPKLRLLLQLDRSRRHAGHHDKMAIKHNQQIPHNRTYPRFSEYSAMLSACD